MANDAHNPNPYYNARNVYADLSDVLPEIVGEAKHYVAYARMLRRKHYAELDEIDPDDLEMLDPNVYSLARLNQSLEIGKALIGMAKGLKEIEDLQWREAEDMVRRIRALDAESRGELRDMVGNLERRGKLDRTEAKAKPKKTAARKKPAAKKTTKRKR